MKRLAPAALLLLLVTAGVWFYAKPQQQGQHERADQGEQLLAEQAALPTAKPAPADSAISATLPETNPGAGNPGQAPVTAKAPPAEPRKRAWDTNYLASLKGTTQGEKIRFELLEGEFAEGTIEHLEHKGNEVIYVSGKLSAPETGRFFFQKQSLPGKAGAFAGVVEFPRSQGAFRIEPTAAAGFSKLVERPLNKVVCLRMPLPSAGDTNEVEEIPPLKPSDFPNVPIPDYQKGIIVLESLPGSTPVIYLDFQGGYTPTWGGITYQRPSVSNAQIKDVWVRVAEDYMPFNINVTTDLKVFQNAPEGRRQRVVITPTNKAAPGAGGVAFVGSFNWTGDTPCWVFITSGKNCAEAVAHEAGHTLGLSHDGAQGAGSDTEYYDGQGSGETGWAPIMGVGYDKTVTQWSKGEYANANNTEDDLAIITSDNNEVDYRSDDTGATLATSRYLEILPNFVVRTQGEIERTGDVDAFRFSTSGGTVSLRADPVAAGPNLAMEVGLYDKNNTLIISSSPTTTLWANLSTNVPAGTYTFLVKGTGRNKPMTDGFSPYASLGYYAISGTVNGALLPDRFSIGENAPEGTVVGSLAFLNPGSNPLSYNITSGNTGGTFSINSTGTVSVANSSLLDYESLALPTQLPIQFELFVEIADSTDGTILESNRRVVVGITNVNEAPTLSSKTAAVLEHTSVGTVVAQADGFDPDFWTILNYSITDGNANGVFAIDQQSGAISVAGDLNAVEQSVYTLTITVSDQTAPSPLVTNAVATITVLPNYSPFEPGSISYAVYTNISGNLLSALTSSSRFPYDPSFETKLSSFEAERDRGDNYGAAVRGYLIPPADGDYTFWVASDDNGELWLSTSTNNAGIKRIAHISGDGNWADPREWTKFPSQRSAGVALKRGEAYYIEARVKEGSGGDHLAVAWECSEAGIVRDIIPGKYLAPFAMNFTPHPVGFTANVHRDAIFGAQVGMVKVMDVNDGDAQTLGILSGSLADVFSFDPATGAFRVASEAALQQSAQTNFNFVVRATDNGSPPRSATANVTLNLVDSDVVTATGLQQEIWYTGSGTTVSVLVANPRYPKRPDELRPLTRFDGGQDLAENYGSRIRGLLTPAMTGTYYFYVSSDDNSSLKMSTTSNPSNAVQIASVTAYTDHEEWDRFASQRSTERSLVAGTKYYLEVLHKEGGGSDHVSVGWSGTGLPETSVIAGSFLEPVDLNYAPSMLGHNVVLLTTATNGTSITSMNAIDSPLDTITYKLLTGNTENLFAIDSASGVITLTNASALTNYADAVLTLTVLAQDSGYGGLYPLKTTEAVVSIQVLYDSPTFTWNGLGSTDVWSGPSNWTPDLPQPDSKLIFRGNTRLTNSNDFLLRAGHVTFLNGGFRLTGNPLVLLAGLSAEGDNTWAIDSKLNQPQSFVANSGVLSIEGDIDTDGHTLTIQASGAVHASGVISGLGGLVKTGPGRLTLSASNLFSGRLQILEGVVTLENPGAMSHCGEVQLQEGSLLDARELPVPLQLQPEQTLTGKGNIAGSLDVLGTLQPGDPTGLLKVDGVVQLLGRTLLYINKQSGASALLQATGSITFGGNLSVTNLGGTLAAGDVFKVFDAPSIQGSFASIELPTLSASLSWDTTALIRDGTLRVAPRPPQFYPVVVNNGSLLLQVDTWTGLTYELQSSEKLGVDAQWTVISTTPGSGSPLNVSLPIDPNKSSSYYRFRVY